MAKTAPAKQSKSKKPNKIFSLGKLLKGKASSHGASSHKSTKPPVETKAKATHKAQTQRATSAAVPPLAVKKNSNQPTKAQQISKQAAVKASSEPLCREVVCEVVATSGGYCRLHYIKNWKKIKRKELILKEGKLNKYIEELVAKYPDRYIEAIRQDLASEKDFGKVVHELDLDEGIDDFEEESDSIDSLIDSIKRDVDDDGDLY